MNTRFALPEMAGLWTDQAKYTTWVTVEILASEAQAKLGRVPVSAVEDMRRAPVPTPLRIAELQQERDHEITSFLAAYCESIPRESARWVHLGMTSSDLVDTALGHILATATDVLIHAARRLRDALTEQADRHWNTVIVGRTHGVHAEPTTFGHKLATLAYAVQRSLDRLAAARTAVAVGTISGAVGTYSQIDPAVERHVCAALGLGIEPAPSQVVARDRHAQLLQAVACLGACVEQLTLELRLLQRTEVAEVEERRSSAYQGSSAMPHKRNPTASEELNGLARLLRGYADTALENVALWHERDLAHKAVEQVILPGSLTIGHYQAARAADLVATLRVDTDRMRAGVDRTGGLIYSSSVLSELLEGGMEREKAYRAVQAAALRCAGSGENLTDVLRLEGIEASRHEPEDFLHNHGVIRKRLDDLRELAD